MLALTSVGTPPPPGAPSLVDILLVVAVVVVLVALIALQQVHAHFFAGPADEGFDPHVRFAKFHPTGIHCRDGFVLPGANLRKQAADLVEFFL